MFQHGSLEEEGSEAAEEEERASGRESTDAATAAGDGEAYAVETGVQRPEEEEEAARKKLEEEEAERQRQLEKEREEKEEEERQQREREEAERSAPIEGPVAAGPIGPSPPETDGTRSGIQKPVLSFCSSYYAFCT